MSMTAAFPGVHSSRLPAAVVVQPRKFEFEDLESVLQQIGRSSCVLSRGPSMDVC
jgi:hypothetical protein